MARIAEIDLVTALRRKVDQAIDNGTEASAIQQKAFRQFFLLKTGTEENDYSHIQSADVNSMVTAVQAQMAVAFSKDMTVEFEANSADDEQMAKAESRAISKIIEENGGFAEIMAATQNALVYAPGLAKVWWDEDINAFFVTHEGLEPEDVSIAAASEPNIERRLVSYDQESGRARIEVTETQRRLRVKAVANDRFFINPDWDEQTLVGCDLCGEIHYKTRDQLSRMGVDWETVKDLPAVVKGDFTRAFRRGQVSGAVDPMQMQLDVCRVYEVYARFARDDADDRAYLYKVWLGQTGDTFLLDPELVQRVPYAVGNAFPLANQFRGQSLAEKVSPYQDGKTELKRQWLSNVRNCSWGRLGVVTSSANAEDLLRPKPGGVIRMKNPDAVVPIPVQDVGASIKLALDEFDKDRSEAGGAALDQVAAEIQVANDTAHGTERVYAAKEILASYQTRNISEMIRQIYLLCHAELRSGEGGPIALKIAEEWRQEDPTQWRERRWCNVIAAPSFGERVHMSNALAMCLSWDLQLLQMGMQDVLITLPGLYKKLTDWLTMNLIANPESYYVDPQSQAAQQAGQMKAQAAQQQAEQQQQLIVAVEEIKAAADRYKVDNETAYNYYKTTIETATKVQENEAQGAVDIVRAASEADIARSVAAGGNGGAANGAQNGNPRGGKPANGGKSSGNGRTAARD